MPKQSLPTCQLIASVLHFEKGCCHTFQDLLWAGCFEDVCEVAHLFVDGYTHKVTTAGEEQNHSGWVILLGGLSDFQPAYPRQSEVNQQQIERALHQPGERLLAVGHRCNGVP